MIIRTDTTAPSAPSVSQVATAENAVFATGGVTPGTGVARRTNAKPDRVPIGVTTYATPPLYSSSTTHGLSERTAAGVTLDDPYAYSLNREHAAQAGVSGGTTQVQTDDTAAVKNQIRNSQLWPDDKLQALGDRMVAAGMISVVTRENVEGTWDKLVDKAAQRYAANPDSALTPEDMITLYGGGKGGGINGPEGLSAKTVVNRQTVLSSNDDARTVIGQLMHSALGRPPTPQEVDDFQVALNDAQRKNPQITTTTSGVGGSTSTTTGGDTNTQVGEQATGARYIDKDKALMKEYAHYQAATTLTNWAMEALRGPYGQ